METMRMNFFMTKKQVQTNKEKIRDHKELLEKIEEKLKNQPAAIDLPPMPEGSGIDMQ